MSKTIEQRASKVVRSEKEEAPKTYWLSRLTFLVCFFASVGLIIGGFFVPPMGHIDGTVLSAVGELLLFPTLLYGFRAIELGMSIKFQKGESSIEIHKPEST